MALSAHQAGQFGAEVKPSPSPPFTSSIPHSRPPRCSLQSQNSFHPPPLRLSKRPDSLSSFSSSSSSSSSYFASSSSSSSSSSCICRASLQALVFDCDGVILESEDLHRRAYNAAFAHFNVVCPGSPETLQWSSEFYDQLQNQIGGGKPKMRWYFKTYGWPSTNLLSAPPESDSDKEQLIDTLQDWKTEKYKEIISSGTVKPRPGVLQLMDEAQTEGLKLAICSAATKSSVVFCLTNLLGKERLEQLDCFLAGDDVEKKKPDPSIYIEAAKRLQVPVEECLVVEDSVIGLQAALGAGMKCIISFTSSTAEQDFSGAAAVFPDLGNVRLQQLLEVMEKAVTLA